MKIAFAADRPQADVLVLPVEKDGLARVEYGALDTAAQRLIAGAAKGARFDGETGSIAEATVAAGADEVTRVVLVGVGNGSEADYERAGGALMRGVQTTRVASNAGDLAAQGGAPHFTNVLAKCPGLLP